MAPSSSYVVNDVLEPCAQFLENRKYYACCLDTTISLVDYAIQGIIKYPRNVKAKLMSMAVHTYVSTGNDFYMTFWLCPNQHYDEIYSRVNTVNMSSASSTLEKMTDLWNCLLLDAYKWEEKSYAYWRIANLADRDLTTDDAFICYYSSPSPVGSQTFTLHVNAAEDLTQRQKGHVTF